MKDCFYFFGTIWKNNSVDKWIYNVYTKIKDTYIRCIYYRRLNT